MPQNPFISSGRPVTPAAFLGRTTEQQLLFDLLRTDQSAIVVGQPHIGKTSLLNKLADPATQQEFLGDELAALTFSSLNLQEWSEGYGPADFWRQALAPVSLRPVTRTVTRLLGQAEQRGYDADSLKSICAALAGQRRRLVLLADEFDRLPNMPNFQTFSFYGTLRSLVSGMGLCCVLASRKSVKELDDQVKAFPGSGGSEPFNVYRPVPLRPFEQTAVDRLLDQAGGAFSTVDRQFILRMAGRPPCWLPMMAAALFEATGEDRHTRAAQCFYDLVAVHFDTLWSVLDDYARTAAVVLCLMELGGRAQGSRFAYKDLEQAERLGLQLQELRKMGLADSVEGSGAAPKHALRWRGEHWTASAQAFVWWVRDVAIARSRRVLPYEEWLNRKRYQGLLTQEQWERLVSLVTGATKSFMVSFGTLAGALLGELTGVGP